MLTAFGHGLAGPKKLGSSERYGGLFLRPFERESGQNSRARAWIVYGNINELRDAGMSPGKRCLCLLTVANPGIGLP
jgi:hypothetical protein